jgi:hypothetical protein
LRLVKRKGPPRAEWSAGGVCCPCSRLWPLTSRIFNVPKIMPLDPPPIYFVVPVFVRS